MNIAFLHNNFPSGGAEKVTIDIARYLSQFPGYNCFVYCMNPREELIDDDLRKIMVIKQIAKTRNIFIKGYKAYRLIKNDKIDIAVQVATRFRDIEKIQQHTGIKVILANHGNTFWHEDPMEKKLREKKRFYKKQCARFQTTDRKFIARELAKEMFMSWYDKCDAYTVLCNKYKEEFEREEHIDPATSHVYAIENAQEAVPDVNYDKEKIILYCGRLDEEKRVDHLLEIWSEVQDKLKDYKLIILGSGDCEDDLKTLAKRLGTERVEFKGRVNNPWKYYDKASILCLTSRREGWPLTLTEAQAYGCIPVAYGCTAGVTDILDPDSDGICGFTIPMDDKHAFAETLIKITSMPDEELRKIRENAVQKRLRYIPEIQFKKWKDLFDKLMTEKDRQK